MEAKLGGLFAHCQKEEYVRKILTETNYPQPDTFVSADNSATIIIANGTAKQ